MKPLDEVALEVYEELMKQSLRPQDKAHVFSFAKALVERLTRDAEPVAHIVSSGEYDFPLLRWISADHSLRCKTGDKLYLHPPLPQPTIDKSMLKRLVTQVFGEGYEIVPRDSWQPIETAPKDLPGFLATNAEEFDSIEWLVDDYGDKNFYNKNSANLTGKANWTHWMPLPSAPNSLTRSLRPTNGPKDISDIGFDREEQTPNIPDGYVLVPKEPTEEMLFAGCNNNESGEDFQAYRPSEVGEIYRDMIAAAPKEESK